MATLPVNKDAQAATEAIAAGEPVTVPEDQEEFEADTLGLYLGLFKIENATHELEFTAKDFVEAATLAQEWTAHPNNSDYTLHGIVYTDPAQWEMSLP